MLLLLAEVKLINERGCNPVFRKRMMQNISS